MTILQNNESNVRTSPASDTSVAAWNYDAILDGLLSGSISGQPMDRQDAQLLLTLLERLGWIPDARRLAGAMPYLTDRLEFGTLSAVMRNLGYACQLLQLHGRKISQDHNAVLACEKSGNLWLVDKSLDGKPKITRPGKGEISEIYQMLKSKKTYKIIHITSAPQNLVQELQPAQQSFSLDLLAGLSPDLRIALVLTVLSGALTVLSSMTVIFLFDLVINGQSPRIITAVLIAVGILFCFDLSFRFLKARLLGRIAGRFEFHIGKMLFDKLLKLPGRMIDKTPIGEQTLRLREFEGLRGLFSGPYVALALELPVTVILVCIIAMFSFDLALLLISVILTFTLAGLGFVPSIVRQAAVLSLSQGAVTRLQMEAIEKRDAIACNGLAWPWAEKAKSAVDATVRARFRLARSSAMLEALSYLCIPVAATSVIFVGAGQVVAGTLSGGELVAVTMLTWRAVTPTQQGLLVLPKTKDLIRLFKQVDAMMRIPEQDSPSGIDEGPAKEVQLTASSIVLRGPATQVPTLAGVSVDLPPGILVSVTGASGSGKSALLGVLAGQIQPQAGSVRFGSVNLLELSSSAIGRQILLIPPRPALIYGSLAQNLRFTDTLVSDERFEETLAEVGLSTLLEQLPGGIHCRIDPSVDTALFTGGVRTAIAVAQALLISPPVLLIDEASENVDPAIDQALLTAVRKRRGKMTTLLVTHRPSVIRASDAILELSDGRADFKMLNEKGRLAV